MSQSIKQRAESYAGELKEIKAQLKERPINWWYVYPAMVRVTQMAKELGLDQPFNKAQLKMAKEKLCQTKEIPQIHTQSN